MNPLCSDEENFGVLIKKSIYVHIFKGQMVQTGLYTSI